MASYIDTDRDDADKQFVRLKTQHRKGSKNHLKDGENDHLKEKDGEVC